MHWRSNHQLARVEGIDALMDTHTSLTLLWLPAGGQPG